MSGDLDRRGFAGPFPFPFPSTSGDLDRRGFAGPFPFPFPSTSGDLDRRGFAGPFPFPFPSTSGDLDRRGFAGPFPFPFPSTSGDLDRRGFAGPFPFPFPFPFAMSVCCVSSAFAPRLCSSVASKTSGCTEPSGNGTRDCKGRGLVRWFEAEEVAATDRFSRPKVAAVEGSA